MKTKNLTKKLVEGSVMIAFATVLSICEIVKMPYGGSVTLASMLPILIIAYRHGVGFGLASAGVFALIQQLLGISNLSPVSTWQSVVAVIVLDYALAFTVIALGALLKDRLGLDNAKLFKKQEIELGAGMALACILRYICHTVAGATVWAGLSIPDEAAMIYSLGYNATYMIPETIVSVLAAVWIGGVMDFSRAVPTRLKRENTSESRVSVVCRILHPVSRLFALSTVAVCSLLVFAHVQVPDSGVFTFALMHEVNWVAFFIVLSVGALLSLGCFIAAKLLERRAK